jgi:transposase InsO family protein/transposase-like protein
MFSLEDRRRAVELYVRYDRSASRVIAALGYPSKSALENWYREFVQTGGLHEGYVRKERYTGEQKRVAVEHYLSHGRCMASTIRALGYPSREMLGGWIREVEPERPRTGNLSRRKFTTAERRRAVHRLCSRETSAAQVAGQMGVSRAVLYEWKTDLIGAGMPDREKHPDAVTQGEVDALRAERDRLAEQVFQLRLNNDILAKAAELLKKDPGADPTKLTNTEKTQLVDALRETYPLKTLLVAVGLAKATYYYQRQVFARPDKYADLRVRVVEEFNKAHARYGYRRLHAVVAAHGRVSEKVVRRIMAEQHLIAKGRSRRRRYSSYLGEISPAPDNLLERDFHADEPNTKWLTDITEFHLPGGKVYLSPVIDCFDGMAVAWSIGTRPDAQLANTSLQAAIATLRDGEHPIIHSDRGGHYRWPEWINLCTQAGLLRSMSKKGCSPDNSACEGFFGRLKNEMFYGIRWQDTSIDDFIDLLEEYLDWYNTSRIKMSLGGCSPAEYRKQLELTT